MIFVLSNVIQINNLQYQISQHKLDGNLMEIKFLLFYKLDIKFKKIPKE